MTPEEALKIDPARYSVHGDVATALRVLQDALREAQAQTVQMREDAALTVEDCLRTGLLTPGNVKTAAAQVRRLPLPAPAVAKVAAPRPLHPADCAHDSTPDVSVPHMPDPCGFVVDADHVACVFPRGHAGWHQTPPVAAPKPAFDAEAALVAAREAARTGLDLNPTVEARQIAHLLRRMLSDALAAGRGAR